MCAGVCMYECVCEHTYVQAYVCILLVHVHGYASACVCACVSADTRVCVGAWLHIVYMYTHQYTTEPYTHVDNSLLLLRRTRDTRPQISISIRFP